MAKPNFAPHWKRTKLFFLRGSMRSVLSTLLIGCSRTRCCDMGQNDTIGKIELKIIFRLAVGISNSRNDIQLFLQLFDELRVNGDYH